MKSLLHTKYIFLSIAFLAIAFFALSFNLTSSVHASAPSGLPATQAIATTTVIGPQNNVTVLSSDNCSARIISTVGTPIQLLMADPTNGDLSSTTLNGKNGLVQAASTTVIYDSGVFGCGKIIGYAAASTTITVIDTR